MKLLITGAWKPTEDQLEQIRGLGHETVYMPDERGALPCGYEEIEAVICNGLFLYHPIEKFTNLTYIQLTSAGLDRVPMAYVRANGIEIHNARGVYSVPMAEFALSSVLSVYKETEYFRVSQSRRDWNKRRDLRELYQKRVVIVGCGHVGTECAKRFAAMGCEVVGVDIDPRSDESYTVMRPVSELNAVLATADVVILTLPLTEETHHLIDRDALKQLPKGAVLVNIARGGIVDTEALVQALRRESLTAILDVFEEEPLSADSPLWELPNAVLTPHNSFVGEGNATRLWEIILNHLESSEKS